MERDEIIRKFKLYTSADGYEDELLCGMPFLVAAYALICELTDDNQAQAETITNLIATIGNAQAYIAQQMLDQLKDKAQIRYNDVGVSFLTVDVADIERVVKKILEGV